MLCESAGTCGHLGREIAIVDGGVDADGNVPVALIAGRRTAIQVFGVCIDRVLPHGIRGVGVGCGRRPCVAFAEVWVEDGDRRAACDDERLAVKDRFDSGSRAAGTGEGGDDGRVAGARARAEEELQGLRVSADAIDFGGTEDVIEIDGNIEESLVGLAENRQIEFDGGVGIFIAEGGEGAASGAGILPAVGAARGDIGVGRVVQAIDPEGDAVGATCLTGVRRRSDAGADEGDVTPCAIAEF